MRELLFNVWEDVKDFASWYGPEILNVFLFVAVIVCLFALGWK